MEDVTDEFNINLGIFKEERFKHFEIFARNCKFCPVSLPACHVAFTNVMICKELS